MLEGAFSEPQLEVQMEDRIFIIIARRLATSVGSIPLDHEKKFVIKVEVARSD